MASALTENKCMLCEIRNKIIIVIKLMGEDMWMTVWLEYRGSGSLSGLPNDRGESIGRQEIANDEGRYIRQDIE